MSAITPMKAKPVSRLPDLRRYPIMQVKLDGWRCVAHVLASRVWLHTYEGSTITSLPYIEAQLAKLPVGTILDGEVLARDWNQTQSIVSRQAIDRTESVTFYVFDLLAIGSPEGSVDATRTAQAQRLALLERLFAGPLSGLPNVKPVPTMESTQENFDRVLSIGFEGVVVKTATGRYHPGVKSPEWLKLKPQHTFDCEILALPHDGEGKYEGQVGAIQFRLPSGGVGRCSGMTDALRQAMTERPQEYIGLIAEIACQEVTKSGKMRHPQFKRLRVDQRGPTPLCVL